MNRFLVIGCLLLTLQIFGEDQQVTFKTYRFSSWHLPSVTNLDYHGETWTDLPVKEVQRRIKASQEALKVFLESEAVEVPVGTTALLDPDTDTLAVRADSSVHEWLKWYEWDFQYSAPKVLQWRLDIIEAASADLLATMDKRDPLGAMVCREQLLRTGKLVTTLRGNGKPGNLQHVSSGGSTEVTTAYSLTGQALSPSRSEPLSTGTSFRMDPVTSEDSMFVDITYQLRHSARPVQLRLETILTGTPQGNSISWTDVPIAEISSAILMNAGATQVLGTWKVGDNSQTSQAAFLRVDYPLVQPPINPQVQTLLQRHAHEVSPMPDPKHPSQSNALPKGMERRSYDVTPDFYTLGSSETQQSDPFGPTPIEPKKRRARAKQILEEQGVTFPAGAEVRYLPQSSVLKVVNTPDNLDLIEAFVMSCISYKSILVTDFTLVEVPADLLQTMDEQLRGSTDHSAVLAELLRKGARVVDSANLCGKPGMRMHYRSGIDYRHAAPPKIHGAIDSKVEQVGLELELEPVLGADNESIAIDLSYRYDMAAPHHETSHSEKGELTRVTTTFWDHQDATSLTTKTGSTRLLSEWTPSTPATPTGAPTLRQALFLKITRATVFPPRQEVGPAD